MATAQAQAKQAGISNERLVREYRCALCWGALVEKYIDGKWVVVCASDAEHEGRVTSTWVESRKRQNVLEAAEVGSRYAKLLGLERPGEAGRRALYGDDSLL